MLTFSLPETPVSAIRQPIFLFMLSLLLATSGCAVQAADTTLPAPAIDTIDGRRVESLTLRHAGAAGVVIFEGGSRNTLDRWGTVPAQIAREATVFAYHRPGYGNSEAVSAARDGHTIVEELRTLLRHQGLPPPYVLVGHSLGGLYVQLFARLYPQEVKGLVLVDALYPGMVKKVEDFPLTTRLLGRLTMSRTVWREIEQIDATGAMVLDLPAVEGLPVVRLVNQPQSKTAVAVDFGAFRMDRLTRDSVEALYPQARKIVVDSSHQMALTSPEVVVDAVREVLRARDPINVE